MPGMHYNGTPARILDLLETHGEMTADVVADRLNASLPATRRALYRLRHEGRVASRPDVGVLQAVAVKFEGNYDGALLNHGFTSHAVRRERSGYPNLWRAT